MAVCTPMYADDLALIASSADELQAMLDIVSQYATKWRYRINPLGCSTIADLITTKKLSFLLSIATLPPETLPRQVLQCRLQESHTKSWISLLESQINELNLPNIATLIQNTPSKSCWKRCIRKILGTHAHLQLPPLEHDTLC